MILETDPSGELTGITLTEPSPDTQMELTATVSVPQSALAATAPISQTVSAATVSVPQSALAAAAPISQTVSAATVSTPQPDTAPSRSASALTPARIKELKENEDVAQLIYICEQYLGRTFTPTDTRKILFFYDELKMSVDLIDFLIQYCVGRGHKSMRYIETVAMAWSKEGITTVEMAKDSTSRYGRDYFTILKAMGITNRNPVDSEIVMMDTWLKDYGFSMDMIQEACSRAVMLDRTAQLPVRTQDPYRMVQKGCPYPRGSTCPGCPHRSAARTTAGAVPRHLSPLIASITSNNGIMISKNLRSSFWSARIPTSNSLTNRGD